MVMSAVGAGFIYYLSRSRERRIKLLIYSAVSVIGVLVLLNVSGDYLKSSGASTFIRLAELANPFNAGSINDRMEHKWLPTAEIIKSSPMGVGIGYGSGTRAHDTAEQSGLLVEPHNELLQKTMETGIVGGLVYLLLVLAVFKDALRIIKANKKDNHFGYAMAGVLAAFLLCGLVNLPFSGSSGLLFWSCAGILTGMVHINEKENKEMTARDGGVVDNGEKEGSIESY